MANTMTVSPPAAHAVPHGHAGSWQEYIRLLVFTTWFLTCSFTIHTTQLFCSPVYFVNKDWFYTHIAFTKQQFGLLITTVTYLFTPTTIRISGDSSVQGQLKKTEDGRLETSFPERIVLISNHQIYTEWLYLWWIAYTSKMHGAVYIILKESLKYIPMVGPSMMFFGFIFMSRTWAKDKPRLHHRLQVLNAKNSGPLTRCRTLNPMWLLIFPEGTNLSKNTRKRSVAWAEKSGIQDLEHLLLPRSTGLLYCLQELRSTVDWLYDCTIAYEGVPRGKYAQDLFTIRGTFFQGRPPKSVNMYWRRIALAEMPLDDAKVFDEWLLNQWRFKDSLLEYFHQNGCFPPNDELALTPNGMQNKNEAKSTKQSRGHIETEVKLASWGEIGQIFVPLATFALIFNVLGKFWNLAAYGNLAGQG